ncbi:tRNA (guanine-N(7)-)-methyltransferase [Sarcoptes scabiei]|uniref:tRNA (guanine-N(7)-)-methyltransferase n=1 Tax=Sarcoptes scabiei TaxID=52283 RepID=A0A132A7Q8_SARSC|nr:tRNA (guanine-N(7)-)-methyltransferase [Sarcoptes scabiei]KPM06899.1 tRNA (guanine-N(7)-)-methyltransferase-like protein [Sarcoptes scabiei]
MSTKNDLKRKTSLTDDGDQNEDHEQNRLNQRKRLSLPQKKFYRQRAHSNPIADHNFDYPLRPDQFDWTQLFPDCTVNDFVEIIDVGCGYGGLLVELAPLFPKTLILGLEIRVKVSNYVIERIEALRNQNIGQYKNINCLRSNAMKYLPNFFRKSQLSKMFFLFPDPHFKKQKHKWRIISPQLLSEYAYCLRIDGRAYFASDVKDLFDWMYKHFVDHPLFQEISEKEIQNDPVIEKIYLTEEAKKVTRNNGKVYLSAFERIQDPYDCKTINSDQNYRS